VQARIDSARGNPPAAAERLTRVIDLLSEKGAMQQMPAAYRQRADVRLQAGDAAQALADARQSLEIARKLQGANPHSSVTGSSYLTLGRVLRQSGDGAGAREALAAALAELQHTLGPDHPETRAASELLATP
jgi:tetratricopeptide (TPR) repeat protein